MRKKCPLKKEKEIITAGDHNECKIVTEKFLDCMEDECAWWNPNFKRCCQNLTQAK